jgi:hypothetical protein
MHTNRRPAFQFGCAGFFGRWIRCQRPLPTAVGDPLLGNTTRMKHFTHFLVPALAAGLLLGWVWRRGPPALVL